MYDHICHTSVAIIKIVTLISQRDWISITGSEKIKSMGKMFVNLEIMPLTTDAEKNAPLATCKYLKAAISLFNRFFYINSYLMTIG